MIERYSVMILVDASSKEEAISKRCEGEVHAVGLMRLVAPRSQKIVAAESWPLVLMPMKLLAKPEDRGAGDIIARTIGPIGGDAFKKWYKVLFGKDCGCGHRQEVLNARWPLRA